MGIGIHFGYIGTFLLLATTYLLARKYIKLNINIAKEKVFANFIGTSKHTVWVDYIDTDRNKMHRAKSLFMLRPPKNYLGESIYVYPCLDNTDKFVLEDRRLLFKFVDTCFRICIPISGLLCIFFTADLIGRYFGRHI